MIAYYLLASRVRMSPGCVNHKTLPLTPTEKAYTLNVNFLQHLAYVEC